MGRVWNRLPQDELIAVASLLAAGIGSAALLWTSRQRRQATTLVAPAAWAGFSFVAIMLSELVLAMLGAAWLTEPLRFAAATTTVCPAVALLGAKRPQNKAWQFIVGSLWGIFVLISLQAVVFYRGGSIEIFAAWRYLLWVLLAVGATNFFGTRFFIPAFLTAAAQVVLLWPFLADVAAPSATWRVAIYLGIVCLAIGLAVYEIPRRAETALPVDRLWRDFRDAYGVVWALRVAQRLRAECHLESAQVHDVWQRISKLADDSSNREKDLAAMHRTLESLLKRFVSAEWLSGK